VIALSPKSAVYCAVEDSIDKITSDHLTADDREHLVDLVRAIRWMNQSLEEKSLSIQRLRKIFGIQTERASHILDEIEKKIDEDRAGKTRPTAPGVVKEAKPRKPPATDAWARTNIGRSKRWTIRTRPSRLACAVRNAVAGNSVLWNPGSC
jgi:hypothetical protein